MAHTPWFVRQCSASARVRLFCFPYAGGSAVSYQGWQAAFGSDIEVCAVQLPGRGMRFCEPAFEAMPALTDVLAAAIAQQDDLPCAFFGHSMGALLAFETARRLRALGSPLPLQLFASGAAAPGRRDTSRPLHRMSDTMLIDALRDYDGTPPEILANAELMAVLLPAIRADFALVETYHYAKERPLDLALTVLAGEQDDIAARVQVDGWRDETAATFDVQWFEGGHFFLHTQRAAVTAFVARALAAIDAPGHFARKLA